MAVRVTIRGTEDEILDFLETLPQVPDHEVALDLFEGTSRAGSQSVLTIEVPPTGPPEVAHGYRRGWR